MNCVRCRSCGLLNFAAAEVCKKCTSPLPSAENAPQPDQQPHHPEHDAGYAAPSFPQEPAWHPQQSYGYPSGVVDQGQGKKTWPVVLAILVMLALAGVPLYMKFGRRASSDLSWREYRADDGSFTILTPGEPETMSTSKATPIGDISVTMSSVKADGGLSAYAFGYAQYPVVSRNVPLDTLFDQAERSMSARSGAVILGRRNITLGGYQGREIELKPPAGVNKDADRGALRLYWAPPRIYIILAGGPDSPAASAARAKFLDSFRINSGN